MWEVGGTSSDATLGNDVCGIRFRGAVCSVFSLNVESIFPSVTKAALCLYQYHQPLCWGQMGGKHLECGVCYGEAGC